MEGGALRTERKAAAVTRGLLELARSSAFLWCCSGWPAHRRRKFSARRKWTLSMSTARSGRRQRVTSPEALKKRKRKMCSAWLSSSTRPAVCSIRRRKLCRAFSDLQFHLWLYVAPTGATATSAGCFITLAANVAAMAPATTIGAAHPVSIGGFSGGGEEKTDDTMKQKLENFSVSYMETIAGKRQRNVEWAKSAVKESASITAQKALELKVIDLIAADMSDLLQKLNGRIVDGKSLNTSGAQLTEIKMSPAERVFQKLWRPEVMFILMLIAIYGIIGELSSPGAILPGVVGAIALILALYLAAVLPVNVAGLVLIALAMALFIFDLYTPTHGVLTVGGIISFLIGSLMLFDRADPLFRLSLSFIIPATLVTAAFFIFVIGKGLRAQMLPVKVGKETLIGRTVTTLTPIDSRDGRIFVEGEYWNAISDAPIEKGEQAEIAAVQGLTIKLTRKPH